MLLSRQSIVSVVGMLVAIIMVALMAAPAAFASDEDDTGDGNGKISEPKANEYKGWTKPDRPTYICQLLGDGKLKCQVIEEKDKAFGKAALLSCVERHLAFGHPAAALTCFIPFTAGLPVFTITPEQQIPG